jgi:hypothetical protein
MTDYASLSNRGQVGRLRALGRRALASFGVDRARLTMLRHETNTTFRVDAAGDRYVLRISRGGTATADTIASEMMWLAALRTTTSLSVPEPVAAADGTFVAIVSHSGVPEPRPCVLLRWMNGRFLDTGLTPRHLGRVGELMAALQDHGEGWARPAGFVRHRVDTLTSIANSESVSASPTAATTHVPSREDADRAVGLANDLLSADAARTVAAALDLVWESTRRLAAGRGATDSSTATSTKRITSSTLARRVPSTSTTAAGDSTSTTSRSPSRRSRAGRRMSACETRFSMHTGDSARCRRTRMCICGRS